MDPLESLLQLLLSTAQPRPFLGQSNPTATFAGRLVPPGQTDLASLLSRPATESPDAEGLGGLAANAIPLIAAGLRAPTRGEIKAITALIQQRGKAGLPMVRGNFRPMIELPSGKQLLGDVGGYHADLSKRIPDPFHNFSSSKWGFATPEGVPVSDAAFHLLTGPPETLKQAGQMLSTGTLLENLLQAIQDAMRLGTK